MYTYMYKLVAINTKNGYFGYYSDTYFRNDDHLIITEDYWKKKSQNIISHAIKFLTFI